MTAKWLAEQPSHNDPRQKQEVTKQARIGEKKNLSWEYGPAKTKHGFYISILGILLPPSKHIYVILNSL